MAAWLAAAAAHVLPRPCATLGAALRAAEQAFERHRIPEPGLSAEHLLTRAAGLGSARAALRASLASPLPADALARFDAMCEQRLRRVPVQYILGDWDFHELTLALAAPVLIPRPETETLVELVLSALRGREAAAVELLDVGCGSGAIGLALLNKLPAARCTALDVRREATDLAAHNARLCRLSERYRVDLVEGGIAQYAPDEGTRFDLIVSNPPYIPQADMATLEPEVAQYEDHGALCGGSDGMDVIRQVLVAAPSLLRKGGACGVWLEVDPSHPPLIERFVTSERPELQLALIQTHNDWYGRQRFCQLQWRG
ncbi:hypothetical protein AB1Y20_001900 [Prymnesium parvum]|uniref:peptide chain release factor N(5)-glutamine methyltransferase n=1 Tax=Prymnesium parvum TaxID=97485 RepID=A0AB34J9K0_PRYPA